MQYHKRKTRLKRICFCCKETINKGDYYYADNAQNPYYGICYRCHQEWNLSELPFNKLSRFKEGSIKF